MIRSLSLVATAITIALASAATSPAADDEQAKALVGSWLVAPENGAKGCRLSLEMAETIGGRVIAGAQACAAALPVLAGATAWKLGSDDTLRIIDVNRKELLRFGQEEGSPWETEEGEPMWLLPALGDLDHVPSVESLVGTWQLKNQSGEALCQIDLTADKDEDGTTKMSPKTTCPASISDMKLSLWATEGFGLVLMGSEGSALAFDMNASGNFEKSADESGPPMLLVRQ